MLLGFFKLKESTPVKMDRAEVGQPYPFRNELSRGTIFEEVWA